MQVVGLTVKQPSHAANPERKQVFTVPEIAAIDVAGQESRYKRVGAKLMQESAWTF